MIIGFGLIKRSVKILLIFFLKKNVIKVELEKNYLSLSHMNKANYNLDFVNFLFSKKKFYDWIIIGCYYSIYHASLSLLSKRGYSSKNHLATLCALIYLFHDYLDEQDINLVSRSSIDKTDVGYFVEARDKREVASYGISQKFNMLEAIELRKGTVDFLNKVRQIREER